MATIILSGLATLVLATILSVLIVTPIVRAIEWICRFAVRRRQLRGLR